MDKAVPEIHASGGSPPEPTRTASAGSGGNGKTTLRKRKKGITPIRGGRQMKEYPVTEGELYKLLTIGFIAAFFLSASIGLLGFGFDIAMNVDLSQAPKKSIAYWNDVKIICWLGSAMFALSLGGLIKWGFHAIGEIKKETYFDEY